MIKSYSRQQKVIALSSAEAELYAMLAASAESLAMIAYCRDLGMTIGGEVYTDSAAALGITHRAGIGKVRHLRTQGMWVQEVRSGGRLSYKKVLGAKNPADVLTKHVPGELLERHLESVGTESRHGRAETAPELNSVESVVICLPMDYMSEYESDDGGPVKRKISWASTISYRAIPATGRGRPVVRKRRTAWPGAANLSDKADEDVSNPGRGSGGVGVRGGAGAGSSVPGGAVQQRWADATDDEFGP